MGKTYAESKQMSKFNWKEWLEAAVRKSPTRMDRYKKSEMAVNWVTCACGNQCDQIPRDTSGMPRDKDLADLGGKFYSAVHSGYYESALGLLELIEKRAAELLTDIYQTVP